MRFSASLFYQMADAILVPYLHTEGAISTEKKDVFTIENCDLTASCSSSNYNYITSSRSSNGGNSVEKCFSRGASPVYSNTHNEWLQSIMDILCSDLCDVSKCVLSITAKYKTGSGLKTQNNAIADIGIGFGYKNSMGSNIIEGRYYTFESKCAFITSINSNGAATSSDNVSKEYSLLDLASQNVWRSYDNIFFHIVSSSTTQSSLWAQTAHSITLSIIKASCTIIYTDYR